EHAPEGFADLVEFQEKYPDRVPIAVAWKRAFPEWAQDHRLCAFLSDLGALSDVYLNAIPRVPASLPLFVNLWRNHFYERPVAELLRKHGERAWRLILTVNHRGVDYEGLVRLAEAIREDDLLLDVNEQFGPALALMFVPPRTEKGSRVFPVVARHAWRTM